MFIGGIYHPINALQAHRSYGFKSSEIGMAKSKSLCSSVGFSLQSGNQSPVLIRCPESHACSHIRTCEEDRVSVLRVSSLQFD